MSTMSALVNAVRMGGAEQEVFRAAVAALAEGTCLPPLAFRLEGETQTTVLARARPGHTSRAVAAGTLHTITYADPQAGLVCRLELTEFRDVPALEWVAHFSHAGVVPSPRLSEVAALDLVWHCDGDAFLYRSPGAIETPRDFQFQCEPLQTIRERRGSLRLAAGREGRSSVDWLPFANLQSGGDGLIVALGWTGQWVPAG